MLHADDLIVADKEEAGTQTRSTDWQRAQKCKGRKININKTEAMVCAEGNEMLMISDNERGRATGENRNENAAVDTWEEFIEA